MNPPPPPPPPPPLRDYDTADELARSVTEIIVYGVNLQYANAESSYYAVKCN